MNHKKREGEEKKGENCHVLTHFYLVSYKHVIMFVDIFLQEHLHSRSRPWRQLCARARTLRRQAEQLQPKCQRCVTVFFPLTNGTADFLVITFRHCQFLALRQSYQYHLYAITYAESPLFAHQRALCSCMVHLRIQKTSPIYIKIQCII